MATFSKSKKKSNPSTEPIESVVLDAADVEGEYVVTRFLPLSFAAKNLDRLLWQENSKKHDFGGVYESVTTYGFVDYPKWDSNLNNGDGGISYGNGRTSVIVQALIIAKNEGKPAPRGIPTIKATGDWAIPIGWGVDAASEAHAKAFALDHNNLVASAGDVTHWDLAKMWDLDQYKATLVELAEINITPITMDTDAIASLLAGIEPPPDNGGDGEGEGHGKGQRLIKCPNCDHEWEAGGRGR